MDPLQGVQGFTASWLQLGCVQMLRTRALRSLGMSLVPSWSLTFSYSHGPAVLRLGPPQGVQGFTASWLQLGCVQMLRTRALRSLGMSLVPSWSLTFSYSHGPAVLRLGPPQGVQGWLCVKVKDQQGLCSLRSLGPSFGPQGHSPLGCGAWTPYKGSRPCGPQAVNSQLAGWTPAIWLCLKGLRPLRTTARGLTTYSKAWTPLQGSRPCGPQAPPKASHTEVRWLSQQPAPLFGLDPLLGVLSTKEHSHKPTNNKASSHTTSYHFIGLLLFLTKRPHLKERKRKNQRKRKKYIEEYVVFLVLLRSTRHTTYSKTTISRHSSTTTQSRSLLKLLVYDYCSLLLSPSRERRSRLQYHTHIQSSLTLGPTTLRFQYFVCILY